MSQLGRGADPARSDDKQYLGQDQVRQGEASLKRTAMGDNRLLRALQICFQGCLGIQESFGGGPVRNSEWRTRPAG